MAESLLAIFKTELFGSLAVLAHCGGHWKGFDDLEIATGARISWFNEERIHGESDDFTPAEVEADYIVKPQVNAA